MDLVKLLEREDGSDVVTHMPSLTLMTSMAIMAAVVEDNKPAKLVMKGLKL